MHKILLSITGFAVFFLFSVTWQLEGQSGMQNVAVQFDVAAALAGSDKDKDKDSDKDKDKDSDKDKDKDGDKNNDKDSNDGSCVCPPGVNACVCADGSTGTPGGTNNAVPQRNSLRSIHGDS